ncbi:hypothetical protein Tco_1030390 [Tanacetum coccineum]|uniref:RNA-directed DNA polymerase, eukaryota n=1 Tax=Tanacetum coccineum TaxID=301880 RepID=A0ABQ5G7R6_9ASTR
MENSLDHLENSHEQLENSPDHVENSTEQIENSHDPVENSSVHVENSPVHLENSPNLSGDPFGGYSFTWLDKHASKISKLDRFLLSDGLLDLFPNLSDLIFHRHIFDHKPIILKESHMDYGPTPFRLFHSWFLEQDFAYVVEDSWNNDGVHASYVMILLKKKLKSLKQTLKTWSIQKMSIKEHGRRVLQDYLLEIDSRLNNGEGLPDELPNLAKTFHDIGVIDRKISVGRNITIFNLYILFMFW